MSSSRWGVAGVGAAVGVAGAGVGLLGAACGLLGAGFAAGLAAGGGAWGAGGVSGVGVCAAALAITPAHRAMPTMPAAARRAEVMRASPSARAVAPHPPPPPRCRRGR